MKKLINPVLNARLLIYPWGDIYQGFGEHIALYQQAIQTNGHNGIDIIKPHGTPIIASEGIVSEVKDTPDGYGKHVRILTTADENGDFLELTHGHLDTILCKIGDKVIDGQQIGTLGNTGMVISGSTIYWGNAPAGKGDHLHYGIRECSTKNTGWQSTYSTGISAYIKNYENGMKGAVDPMKYLDVPEDITAKVEALKGLVANLVKLVQDYIKSLTNKGR